MRTGKILLVWALVTLLAVDSASACRWGWGGYASSCGSSYSSGYASCGSSSCYSQPFGACTIPGCTVCASSCGESVESIEAPAPSRAPSAKPITPPTPRPTFEEPAPGPAPAPAPTPVPSPLDTAPLPPAAEPPALTPPAAEPPAAQPPAAMPPSNEVEDLFKEPAAPAPGAEPAPAPGAPATTPPSDNVEDLFKDAPAPGAAPPAEAPAAPGGDVEDLFKDTDKSSSTTAPAPASQKTADQPIEDLFAEPSDAQDGRSQAIEAEADQLFETPAEGASAMRTWTDNTGKYQVRARLITVSPTHVRLLKENGKYTTVPVERLSGGDLAFAREHGTRAIARGF